MDLLPGCFGAAMRKSPDGVMEGVKCLPFNYSDHEMRSIPNFKKDLQDENKKKKELGDIPTKTGKVSIWKGGYVQRYDTVIDGKQN